MQIELIPVPQLGTWDAKYKCWKQTGEERKREDIIPTRLYLVKYSDIWLLGRFHSQWYGWSFYPNMGSMSMQIEHLTEIYEVQGLPQAVDGSTGAFIMGYLADEKEAEDDDGSGDKGIGGPGYYADDRYYEED